MDLFSHGFDGRNGRARHRAGLGAAYRFINPEAFCLPVAHGSTVGGGVAQHSVENDDDRRDFEWLVADFVGAALSDTRFHSQGSGDVQRSGHRCGPGYNQGCEEEVVFDFGRPLDASGGRACESCGGGVESKGQVAEGHGGGEAWPLQVEGRVWAQKRPKGGHGEEQRRPVRTKEEGCTWERPRAKRVRSTDWHAVAVRDGKVTPWWPQMQLRLYQARSAAEVALELSLGSRGMVRGRLVVQLRLADDCGIGRPLLLDEWRSLLGMHCACATRSPAAGEV